MTKIASLLRKPDLPGVVSDLYHAAHTVIDRLFDAAMERKIGKAIAFAQKYGGTPEQIAKASGLPLNRSEATALHQDFSGLEKHVAKHEGDGYAAEGYGLGDKRVETAKRGGIQEHSVGGLLPFILVAIENPRYDIHASEAFCASDRFTLGHHEGTFWYVQNPDGSIGSRLFKTYDAAANYTENYQLPRWKAGLKPDTYTRADWSWIQA